MIEENQFIPETIILIVEDKTMLHEFYHRILVKDGPWRKDNLIFTSNATDAMAAIEDYNPHIVLLDLQIPMDSNSEARIANSALVLDKIEQVNLSKNLSAKVIVISESVNDQGTQKLIAGDRSRIIKFLDKQFMRKNFEVFSKELLRLIERFLNEVPEQRPVSFESVRKNSLRELEKLDNKLWTKIDRYILKEFEALFEKKANIEPRARAIITYCGIIVEEIIKLLQHESFELANDDYIKNERSIRKRLYALTGRKFIGDNTYSYDPDDCLISRSAAEYAELAYRMRNAASHTDMTDNRNRNMFQEYRYKKEDAAVAIGLIVPLIQDYMYHVRSIKK